MNNLQVGNGYIIFEGLAPDLAQGFGAAGGVGGAGAGQLDRRDAGHRQQILCIDAVGRGPVAEYCLNGCFAKRDAMSFGTTSRIEASDAPVMVRFPACPTGRGHGGG